MATTTQVTLYHGYNLVTKGAVALFGDNGSTVPDSLSEIEADIAKSFGGEYIGSSSYRIPTDNIGALSLKLAEYNSTSVGPYIINAEYYLTSD